MHDGSGRAAVGALPDVPPPTLLHRGLEVPAPRVPTRPVPRQGLSLLAAGAAMPQGMLQPRVASPSAAGCSHNDAPSSEPG